MSSNSVGAGHAKAMLRSASLSSLTNIRNDSSGGQVHTSIFSGKRFLLVGFPKPGQQELTKRINERGGQVIKSADYELHTHICVAGETYNSDKRIVTKEWVKRCCDQNKLLEICDIGTSAANRRIFYFEPKDMILHELCVCETDSSEKISLQQYVDELQALTITHVTPGGHLHKTITTAPEVKNVVRDIYLLLKSLHKAKFSLGGAFSIGSFCVDKSRMRINVKFASTAKSALQEYQPDTKKKDEERFVRMILREVFKEELPPHDIMLWLSLIGQKDVEDLLPHHVLLMDVELCSEQFMNMYDIFLDLAEAKAEAKKELYGRICKNLDEYNGWRDKIKGKEGNWLLDDTLEHGDYKDTVEHLLKLLRNSKQHGSRSEHRVFSLIVGQRFPNLFSDLQKQLFLAGYLTITNGN